MFSLSSNTALQWAVRNIYDRFNPPDKKTLDRMTAIVEQVVRNDPSVLQHLIDGRPGRTFLNWVWQEGERNVCPSDTVFWEDGKNNYCPDHENLNKLRDLTVEFGTEADWLLFYVKRTPLLQVLQAEKGDPEFTHLKSIVEKYPRLLTKVVSIGFTPDPKTLLDAAIGEHANKQMVDYFTEKGASHFRELSSLQLLRQVRRITDLDVGRDICGVAFGQVPSDPQQYATEKLAAMKQLYRVAVLGRRIDQKFNAGHISKRLPTAVLGTIGSFLGRLPTEINPSILDDFWKTRTPEGFLKTHCQDGERNVYPVDTAFWEDSVWEDSVAQPTN